MIILHSALPIRVHICIYQFEFDTLQALIASIIHWPYNNTFHTTWIIFRLKKYSAVPVCSLFCTLMWFARSRDFFFFFFFFFFCYLLFFLFTRNFSALYTVHPTEVFSFARSRFLVFPCEMVWLFILVRLISNLFSFRSRFKKKKKLNKSIH